jgi:hypothetical protein
MCRAFISFEAYFGKDSIINVHNNHQWAEDNAHGMLQSRKRKSSALNIVQVLMQIVLWAHMGEQEPITEISRYMG